jgi:acyl-CoA synthetase (AMP-forming)/AMP-acid ligase II
LRPVEHIDLALQRFADRIAIFDAGFEWTYADVGRETSRLAAELAARGCQRGAVVGVYSWNDRRAFVAWLAILRMGAVALPLNAAASAAANLRLLRHARARWVFHHPALAEEAAALKADSPSVRDSIRLDDRSDGASPVHDEPLDSSNAAGEDDPVVIAPTGGTTGAAKAVVICNAAFSAYIHAYRGHLAADDPVGLTASQLTPASLGMSVVLFTLGARQQFHSRFVPREVVHAIEAHRVTHMWLPPTALIALTAEADSHPRDVSSLRAVVAGGASIAPEQLRSAVRALGPCVCHSYGQMETGTVAWLDAPTVAGSFAGVHPERLASCGKTSEAARVAIVNERGDELPPGQTGEVVVSGRSVCDYFDDPELTRAVRTNSWHHTGDLGCLDAEGYLFIQGRLKDLIVTGGCNVFPAEVEAAMLEMADVRECAVVGQRHPLLGEVVVAVVVSRAATVEVGAIVAHCRRRLGSIRSPKRIELWDDLPKTAAGKIDKAAVRDRLSAA